MKKIFFNLLKLAVGVLIFTLTILATTKAQNIEQKGYDILGENVDDLSGWSLSLSSDGNILAIGSFNNDDGGQNSGHVRVYEWKNKWVQRGEDINGKKEGDLSGWSISLSDDGNILAIGATDSDGNGSKSGQVRIFKWENKQWTQKGEDINGEAEGDLSGWSVSLSSEGNTVAIGARFNDGTIEQSGHVRIYEWNKKQWVQKGIDIDGEGGSDLSGLSVDINSNGSIVAIGAPYNDGGGQNSGHVRIYEWKKKKWVQRGNDIDGEKSKDYAGWSTSISADGTVLAIGDEGSNAHTGQVRIFKWNGAKWMQKGISIKGENLEDQFGASISMSSDGNTIAIGSIGNDDLATDAGKMYVYRWDGSEWALLNKVIGKNLEDNLGWAVSINSAGNSVAVSAIANDQNGANSGVVQVYSIKSLSEKTASVK